MARAEQFPMQQFEVAAVAAPPALLCLQLQQSSVATREGEGKGAETAAVALDLVLQNPALLLRVLEAQFQSRAGKTSQPLSRRLATLDLQWLHSLLSDSALQQVLPGRKTTYQFCQLHWQQARHTALLARELARFARYPDPVAAEACGLLLGAGALVLEQQHREAWVGLLLETGTQERLATAEQQTLGLDHVEAGVRLLQGWALEQDCVDSLRYQMMPLDAVLDASPLVRLCWLANQLARQGADTGTLQAAEQVLQLGAADMEKILREADEKFRSETDKWRGAARVRLSLPPNESELRVFNHEVKESVQKLQWQLLSESALAALEGLDVGSEEDLRAVLTRALQQADVDPVFIVLTGEGRDYVRAVSSNRVRALPASLGLRLQAGRSALADLILADELGSLAADSDRLTVIDRQMLDLLGGSGLLCEPVRMPGGHAVLLLAASANYPQRGLLREFVQRKLQAFMQAGAGKAPGAGSKAADGDSVPLLLYRQQVREAIHEANNPLAIIKNYLQILNMKQGETGAGKEIRLINTEIDRVAKILANLRHSDSRASEPAELDINALLRSMHKVFAQAFSADKAIRIELDLAQDPLHVMGKSDALKQVLTNLVKNAAEAILDSGTIVLSTRRNVISDGTLYMQLTIRDDGPGLGPDMMQRLFVAGKTTKGAEHSGSGLAIVKRLVDGMAGRISCQSDGNGTVFSILLPQLPAQGTQATPGSPGTSGTPGTPVAQGAPRQTP